MTQHLLYGIIQGEKRNGRNSWIDEIVPCLKDTQTGEIKETVVFKIESRAYLKKFRKSNG